MERKFKGKSIIDFPTNYTIVDIETTGLSPQYDSIIEISALKVKNNEPIDSFSSLIKPDNFCPEYLDSFITELTGITDDMLSTAPSTKTVLSDFLAFVCDDIIIGHNVSFDVNFVYDNVLDLLDKPFSNNYIDTMRISRRLNTDMSHHRLKDIAKKYNIPYEDAHRALNDCKITFECYKFLSKDVLDKYDNINTFCQVKPHVKLKAKDISTENTVFDDSNPLYDKTVVFTGTLEKMTRKEAMQIVVDLGGYVADSVTASTNYLILADTVYNTIDGKSSKQKKAESLRLKGNDIAVIPESVFYDFAIVDNSEKIPNNNNSTSDMTETEICTYLIDILATYGKNKDLFAIDHPSSAYTTLKYNGSDLARIKSTKKVRWISIGIGSSDRKKYMDSPLFATHNNKNTFHWKSYFTSDSELEQYIEILLGSYVFN